MKFRHKIEKTNINGLKEFSVNYFLCDELLIGRGSGCLIRLENRLVGLNHAKVYTAQDTLVIEDLGDESGTRVNDVLITKSVLKAGDRVKIGDVTFTVFFDGNYWGFHELREERPEEDRDEVVKRQLKQLDLSRYYPRFLTFSSLIAATVALVAFVEPYVGERPELWSSGPISNHHKIIEKDCRSCHTKSFRAVEDDACLKCHRLSEHSTVLSQVVEQHPQMNFSCEDCHHEHNGTKGLVEERSALCLQCHASLDKLYPLTKHPDIRSVNRHPEFTVTIPQYGPDDEVASQKRVVLSDRQNLLDTTRLKLNHEKHLVRDLRSPTGPKTLQCNDCHKLSADLKTIVPMTYEQNCASCHPLGFDERLPTKAVPHGDPDTVFNFVYAEYAKLFLDVEHVGTRREFVRRFRPGEEPQAENPNVEFTRQFVDGESRKAEKELFTKTACFLCHQVKQLPTEERGKSSYRVLKPNVPDRWMPASRFDHGAHQDMSCEGCHPARKSTQTTDVLMPPIANCRTCHHSPGAPGKVDSECITCHSYHDQQLLKKAPVFSSVLRN
ncbi:MAG: cytochrome c3 family protein [Bdellovibrionota bacterium]